MNPFLALLTKAEVDTLFARANNSASSVITQIVRTDKWEPPPEGLLRLDVDAGVKESLGMFSVGAVIRNHLGIICAAAASSYRLSGTVVDAELRAIYFGMKLAVHCDLHNVGIFSDSSLAMKEVQSKEEWRHFAVSNLHFPATK